MNSHSYNLGSQYVLKTILSVVIFNSLVERCEFFNVTTACDEKLVA